MGGARWAVTMDFGRLGGIAVRSGHENRRGLLDSRMDRVCASRHRLCSGSVMHINAPCMTLCHGGPQQTTKKGLE